MAIFNSYVTNYQRVGVYGCMCMSVLNGIPTHGMMTPTAGCSRRNAHIWRFIVSTPRGKQKGPHDSHLALEEATKKVSIQRFQVSSGSNHGFCAFLGSNSLNLYGKFTGNSPSKMEDDGGHGIPGFPMGFWRGFGQRYHQNVDGVLKSCTRWM